MIPTYNAYLNTISPKALAYTLLCERPANLAKAFKKLGLQANVIPSQNSSQKYLKQYNKANKLPQKKALLVREEYTTPKIIEGVNH